MGSMKTKTPLWFSAKVRTFSTFANFSQSIYIPLLDLQEHPQLASVGIATHVWGNRISCIKQKPLYHHPPAAPPRFLPHKAGQVSDFDIVTQSVQKILVPIKSEAKINKKFSWLFQNMARDKKLSSNCYKLTL